MCTAIRQSQCRSQVWIQLATHGAKERHIVRLTELLGTWSCCLDRADAIKARNGAMYGTHGTLQLRSSVLTRPKLRLGLAMSPAHGETKVSVQIYITVCVYKVVSGPYSAHRRRSALLQTTVCRWQTVASLASQQRWHLLPTPELFPLPH